MNTDITNSFGLTRIHPFAQQERRMFRFGTTYHHGVYPPNTIVPFPYQGPTWIPVNNNLLGSPYNFFIAPTPIVRQVQNTRMLPQSGLNKMSELLKIFAASLQQRATNGGTTSGTF